MESVGVAWRCRSVHNSITHSLKRYDALRCVPIETDPPSAFLFVCVTLEQKESAVDCSFALLRGIDRCTR